MTDLDWKDEKKALTFVNGMAMTAAKNVGVVQNNTKKDIIPIDNYSYKVVYNTGREKIHTFSTELEMAEKYSNEWYEIYE